MYGNDYSMQSEANYRADRVRKQWGTRRKDRRRARRWQGPLRGAEEMR